jgi:hypothetical protein
MMSPNDRASLACGGLASRIVDNRILVVHEAVSASPNFGKFLRGGGRQALVTTRLKGTYQALSQIEGRCASP